MIITRIFFLKKKLYYTSLESSKQAIDDNYDDSKKKLINWKRRCLIVKMKRESKLVESMDKSEWQTFVFIEVWGTYCL